MAVGLFLYGLLALTDDRKRFGLSGWLIGAAVAVQPLVLLALPVALVLVPPRRIAGFVARAAAPGAVLLALAAGANWSATFAAVVRQPNQPSVNHLDTLDVPHPHAANRVRRRRPGTRAGGPRRRRAGARLPSCRRRRPAGGRELLADLLWWTAAALAVRSFFEPVMVAYYLWPPLVLALLAAATDRRRLVATSVGTTTLTFVTLIKSQTPGTGGRPSSPASASPLLVARPAGAPRQPGDVAVQEHAQPTNAPRARSGLWATTKRQQPALRCQKPPKRTPIAALLMNPPKPW